MDACYAVRPALPADLAALPAIERVAGQRFAAEDLPPALRDQALPQRMLQRALLDGWLWVAVRAGAGGVGQPVGFALGMALAPGLALLAEIDVLPAHGRRGLGAALIGHMAQAACVRGHGQLALVTFEHLPWNAPMYEKLGFVRRRPDDPTLHPLLRDALDDDAARGLRRRVVMTLALTDPQ